MSTQVSPDRGLVIIPALNEAATIDAVIAHVRACAPSLDVLVVDDGSHDDTALHAAAARAAVVSHPINLGYGAALQTGYKYADRHGYAFVVQMDADGQHDAADVMRLIAPLTNGTADVVIGSRFVADSGYRMGVARSAGRAFFRRLLVVCGGPHIDDPTSGFQALARAAYRFCCADFYPSDFPDVDVLLLLHRQRFRILEIPVQMAPNPPGHSPMHAGWRALYYPYKMLLATLRALSLPALPASVLRGDTRRPMEE